MSHTIAAPTLTIPELEQVYDQLAQAIDRAGPERSELLLVKLALLAAREIGEAPRFAALIAAAERDLR